MGLLKKKTDEALGAEAETADAVAAPAMDTPAPGAPVALDPAPAEEGAVLAAEDGGGADAALEAEGAPEGGEPAAEGSDLLLNMFASSQVASDDRELLVQLAGDVEVVDLVDQARTLAAAMNIALAAD